MSIFTSQVPAGITANDNNGSGIELGVRFRSTIAGYILGVRFYKTPGNTGMHSAQLYSFDGSLLASADFNNETDSGWQSVFFSSAVPITANTTYIAAYFSGLGNYAYTPFGFNSAISNGPLTGLADGADGINGLYKYTGMPAFPGLGHLSNNYWVDVIESGYREVINYYLPARAEFSDGTERYTGTEIVNRVPSFSLLLAEIKP